MGTKDVRSALRNIQVQLEGISDAPDLDAERLVAWALSLPDTTQLHINPEAPISQTQQDALAKAVSDRRAGKPLAYILGEAEFYGRPFFVTGDVLVPRPDTESLITHALEYASKKDTSLTIADIGTGSGCIAITLALEIPSATIIATDISKNALAIAKKNAARHNVSDRITFLEGDMLEPIANTHIDLIVSNPPYVPTHEVVQAGSNPQTQGLLFEPYIALDGGVNGKQYIEILRKSGIPAIVEGIGGKPLLFSL